MKKQLLVFAVLAVGAAFFAGCAITPSGVGVNIHSAVYLNPDVDGQASPVVLSIYQLKTPFSFDNADYSSLSADATTVLGSDLIDRQTLEIRPGQSREIHFELSQNTAYIGVAAAYRNIGTARWRTGIQLPRGNKSVAIAVTLESQGVSAHLLKSKQE